MEALRFYFIEIFHLFTPLKTWSNCVFQLLLIDKFRTYRYLNKS